MVTQEQRDMAARGGRMAGKANRGIGGACPYDANGSTDQRVLAAVFVRAYFDAGGKLDALDFGDAGGSSSTSTRTSRTSSSTSTRTSPPGRRPYGHLGYLQ